MKKYLVMKKAIGVLALAFIIGITALAFTACGVNPEDYYGTYRDDDNRMELILSEDGARFGTDDKFEKYFVNYGADTIGIHTDSSAAFWGTFEYTFKINADGTLELISTDDEVNDAYGTVSIILREV